jgi:hypothetical protein
LVLPLFLVTLAMEIPLLRRLMSLTWHRAIILGFGINVAITPAAISSDSCHAAAA